MTFADAAMFARESPALTVRFATMPQFVPFWPRTGMMHPASAVMKRSDDRISAVFAANRYEKECDCVFLCLLK